MHLHIFNQHFSGCLWDTELMDHWVPCNIFYSLKQLFFRDISRSYDNAFKTVQELSFLCEKKMICVLCQGSFCHLFGDVLLEVITWSVLYWLQCTVAGTAPHNPLASQGLWRFSGLVFLWFCVCLNFPFYPLSRKIVFVKTGFCNFVIFFKKHCSISVDMVILAWHVLQGCGIICVPFYSTAFLNKANSLWYPAMITQHIAKHFIWYLLNNLVALMTLRANVSYPLHLNQTQDIFILPCSV